MVYNLLKNVGQPLSSSSFPQHVFHPLSGQRWNSISSRSVLPRARNSLLDSSASCFLVKTIPNSCPPTKQSNSCRPTQQSNSCLPTSQELEPRLTIKQMLVDISGVVNQQDHFQVFMVSVSIVGANTQPVCPQSVCATPGGRCGRCVMLRGAACVARVWTGSTVSAANQDSTTSQTARVSLSEGVIGRCERGRKCMKMTFDPDCPPPCRLRV